MTNPTIAVIKSDWLNIASSDTSQDAMLQRLKDAAVAELVDMCNQPLESTAQTLYVEGSGNCYIPLYYTVPVSLTSLAYRSNPTESWTTLTGAVVVERYGISHLYISQGFTSPDYRIIANVGYAAANVPAVITQVLCEMIKELWYMTPKAAQAERFGVTAVTESQSGVSVSKALQRIRDRVRPQIEPYRRIVI